QRLEVRPSSQQHFTQRSIIPETSPSLLRLCGDMQCYRLLETPLQYHLKEALSHSRGLRSPVPLIRRRLSNALQIALKAALIVFTLAFLGGVWRVSLLESSRRDWERYLLVNPINAALCLLPVSLPMFASVFEAVTTALVLALFDTLLVQQASSERLERLSAGPAAEPTDDLLEELDVEELDVEERQEALSLKRRVVSVGSVCAHFLSTLRTRWRSGLDLPYRKYAKTQVPIPLLQCHLIERLGGVTMLCMLDEDTVCNPYSAAQELFVLNPKEEAGTGSVFDLHSIGQDRSVQFEDTHWWAHLDSLKPIGLSCLLATQTASHAKRRPSEIPKDAVSFGVEPALIDHIRRPLPLQHLYGLAAGIGFCEQDRSMFRERRLLHMIDPKLSAERSMEDAHAQGQEETRRRGSIQPHVTGVVVEDRRSRALQLFSRGNPKLVLDMCPDYWDGSTISAIPASLRRAIIDMHQQWSLEDLDVVAFSYSPVPYTVQPLLSNTLRHHDYFIYTRDSAHGRGHRARPAPSVRKSESDAMPVDAAAAAAAVAEAEAQHMSGHSTDTNSRSRSPSLIVTHQKVAAKGPELASVAADSPSFSEPSSGLRSTSGWSSEATLVMPIAESASFSPGMVQSRGLSSSSLHSSTGPGVGPEADDTPPRAQMAISYSVHGGAEVSSPKSSNTSLADSSAATGALWDFVHEQVFLGMVASSVAPRKAVSALIEDVSAAGVRFVYFSPRNMRRSKALAESMGIETDWNCAISLRTLEEPGEPDPHRMTSSYADWDVKARLPHGIAAIKEHIESIDNVPLLVSLFTDATPTTTREMLHIFQEHDESVMCVGCSYRCANASLFKAADVGVLQEGLPVAQRLSTLPASSKTRLSKADCILNSKIVGLHTALTLHDVHTGSDLSSPDKVLLPLLREGRRILANMYQVMALAVCSAFGLSLLILLSSALPFTVAAYVHGIHIMWMLWVIIPILSFPLLAAAADASVGKGHPEKNSLKSAAIARRHLWYMFWRMLPAVLGSLLLYLNTVGHFLKRENPLLAASCATGEEASSPLWIA
ncbi:unnamed protein product, partial [Chrysoparadoxa australica]